ncbi:MAG TPA: hypothetical protein PK263_03950 [bacterium]|nr:hypothetical protein [bacterium]
MPEIAKNVTIATLDFFLGIPETTISITDRKTVYRAIHGYFPEKKLTVESVCSYFNSLRKSGYIEVVKDGEGKESVCFTNKAVIKILDRISGNSRCDGRSRFISFDIPERFKSKRNLFRRAIKRMGFKQIQKSLWVCDRNIGDLVELVEREYGVSQYVVYIVAEKTDIDSTIREMFLVEN